MKSRYLIIGIFYILICMIDSFKIRIVAAIALSILFRYLFTELKTIVVECFLVVLIIASIPLNANYFGKGHICQIKDNYCIVNNHLYSVIVYGLDNAKLDDEVIINSEIKKIHSYSNFSTTTFESYCKGNNIVGQITYDNFSIIPATHSLRQKLYEGNESINQWANSVLFGKGIAVESENSYLVFASSMQISFFIHFIRKLISKYLYPKKTLQLTILFTFILSVFFHFSYGFVRVLIGLIIEYLIKDRRDKVGFYIIALCIYRPYYVKAMAFLIPVGIRILNLFKKEQNILSNTMYIVALQLYFNGSVDVIEVVMFKIYRIFSGMIYILAMIVSLVKIPIPLDNLLYWYLNSLEHDYSLVVTGKPVLIVMMVILLLIYQYNAYKRYKYVLYFFIAITISCNASLLSPIYTVTFLDVGQGDCAIITEPFSSDCLMIDVCGNVYKDIAKDILVPYLNQSSLKSVEVIISHEDYDHSGGLKRLVELFDVGNIYTLKQQCIQFHHLNILDPLYMNIYEDINDNSLISYIEINGFHFLFTGDISSTVEKDLVELYDSLTIDVLKLSHHGSNTASSDQFFRNCAVRFGIISVSYNNRYGHPSDEVLSRLEKYDIDYLKTSDSGAIRFYIFHKFMIYQTSRGQFGLLVQ